MAFVRAGADAARADGSRAAPFATLTAALEHAPDDGVVLVARGTYRERLRIDRSVAVLGACAARVTLDGADLPSAGPVVVNALGEGVRVTLRGVTVRGAAAGVRAHSGAHVRVERVVVADCQADGLYAYEAGSVLEAVDSVVRGVRERTALLGGFGLDAFDGGAVRATDVAVERATAFGVAVRLRGEVTLERCVVRDTQRGAGGDSFGTVVRTGSSLAASETVFTENRTVNVSGQEGGATLTLRDVALLSGGDAPGGAGVQVYAGASLRAVGLQVLGARGVGVSALGAGTSAVLAGSLVRRTEQLAGNGGQGLVVDEGAALAASSTAVEASVAQGVLARGAGSALTLEGCAVRDTAAGPAQHNGAGLLAMAGASLRARGIVVERSVSFGLIAHGEGTTASLAGSAIRDTRHDAWGAAGKGAAVSVGASLDLTGVLVADSFEEGLFATAAGTRLAARDLLVLGTRPSDGGLGHAILIDGARSELDRVALQGCAGAGLLVSGSNRAEAPTAVRDLVVREVRPGTIRSVFEGATPRPFGPLVSYGIHANYGGAVAVTGALVDVGDLGLFNAGGELSLTDAVVSRQREGVGGYAAGTPPGATTLVRVVSVDNVDGALRLRNDLPAAASLGAPLDPCADGCL
ncbi:MAG: right-handed parallel beta-helix repeat-containing protein [Polyangiales bacterium]